MSEDPEATTVDRLAPEAAFALLGNETRIAVLHELKRADGPVRFGELRERVGVADSGRFNYHLQQLGDRFVRKADGGEGYELTLAGDMVVGAMLAGTFTASPTIEPIAVDEPCPSCGGTLVAEYVEELVQLHCTDCEDWWNRFPFPPGGLEDFDRAELPLAFDRWLRTSLARAVDGFCTTCTGRLETELVTDPDHPQGVSARYRCPRCGDVTQTSVLGTLLFHPAFVAFAHDHGLDVREEPTWRLDAAFEHTVTVVDEDPLRVEAVVELGGDRLVVAVDEDLAVEVLERSEDRPGPAGED